MGAPAWILDAQEREAARRVATAGWFEKAHSQFARGLMTVDEYVQAVNRIAL